MGLIFSKQVAILHSLRSAYCQPSRPATCSCLAAWSGEDCGVLNLLPASRSAGLHAPGSRSAMLSSWGGSVGFDSATNRWQMYAAEMAGDLGPCGIGI